MLIFSPLIVFHLFPSDREPSPQRESAALGRGAAKKSAWLTPFYSPRSHFPPHKAVPLPWVAKGSLCLYRRRRRRRGRRGRHTHRIKDDMLQKRTVTLERSHATHCNTYTV
jgi:hypothetical protein